MRSLVFLAALATPSVAFADVSNLQSAFRAKDDGGLTDLLADRVDVQIAVDQPTCAKLAGTLPRDKVGPCLHALAGRFPLLLDEGMVGSELVVVGNHGLALALSTKHGKIVAIGPLAPNAADRKLPTTLNELGINFEPSPKLAAALGDKDARAIHKVCYDEHGTITSRRLVTSSKIPAFDKESTASLAARKTVTPFAPFDTAIAACDVVEMVVVHGEPNGVEGGEVGGVVGGVVGGEMGSPPPPPPPPPPPHGPSVVPPALLEGSRIAGDKRIVPDDDTKRAIATSGKSKVIGSFKLCLSVDGDVPTVTQLKSTGFPGYDTTIKHTIETTWRYAPYLVNGKAIPVCTAVTFIYSQQ